ncbi:unnamed protein product, partial [Rotaria sp. Silwood1]
AVVIVFTICQIPQAISLTVQSFFPILAQTSKVLIYNNFANCFVAINASTNFLLYCCFSDRFRLTFRSNFAFLSNNCAYSIQPGSKMKRINKQHTNCNSFDTVSLTNQSIYSLHGNQCHTRISNLSIDINAKYNHNIINQRQSQMIDNNIQSWFSTRLSNLSSKLKLTEHNNQLDGNRFSQSTDSYPSSPTISIRKSSLMFTHQKRPSNISTGGDRTLRLSIDEPTPKQISKAEKLSLISSKYQSSHLNETNRSILKSIPYSKSSSHRSLTDNNQKQEHIWIKNHRSHSTNEQLLNREKIPNLTEIIDVTV